MKLLTQIDAGDAIIGLYAEPPIQSLATLARIVSAIEGVVAWEVPRFAYPLVREDWIDLRSENPDAP